MYYSLYQVRPLKIVHEMAEHKCWSSRSAEPLYSRAAGPCLGSRGTFKGASIRSLVHLDHNTLMSDHEPSPLTKRLLLMKRIPRSWRGTHYGKKIAQLQYGLWPLRSLQRTRRMQMPHDLLHSDGRTLDANANANATKTRGIHY